MDQRQTAVRHITNPTQVADVIALLDAGLHLQGGLVAGSGNGNGSEGVFQHFRLADLKQGSGQVGIGAVDKGIADKAVTNAVRLYLTHFTGDVKRTVAPRHAQILRAIGESGSEGRFKLGNGGVGGRIKTGHKSTGIKNQLLKTGGGQVGSHSCGHCFLLSPGYSPGRW